VAGRRVQRGRPSESAEPLRLRGEPNGPTEREARPHALVARPRLPGGLEAPGQRVKITYLPVLQTLRDLYLQPRDVRRFRAYVATLTGGTDDVVLPIGVAN